MKHFFWILICFAPLLAQMTDLSSVPTPPPPPPSTPNAVSHDSNSLAIMPGGEAREFFLMGKVALESGKSDDALRYFLSARAAIKDSNSAAAKGVSIYLAMVYYYNQSYVDCYSTGYKAMSVLPPGGFRQKFERMLLKAKMEVLAEHKKMEDARLAKEAEQKRLAEQEQREAEQKLQAQIEADHQKAEAEEHQHQIDAASWNEYQQLFTDYPPLNVAFTGNPIHSEAAIYLATGGLPTFQANEMQAFRNWQPTGDPSGGYWVFRGSWGEKNIRTKWSTDSIIYLPNQIHRPWMLGLGYGMGLAKHNGFVGDWDMNVSKEVLACPANAADCSVWYATDQFIAYDFALFELNLRWQYRLPGAWRRIMLSAGVQGGIHMLTLDDSWSGVYLSSSYSPLGQFISNQNVVESFLPKSVPVVLSYFENGAVYLDYKLILELGVDF